MTFLVAQGVLNELGRRQIEMHRSRIGKAQRLQTIVGSYGKVGGFLHGYKKSWVGDGVNEDVKVELFGGGAVKQFVSLAGQIKPSPANSLHLTENRGGETGVREESWNFQLR
ncbi:hypothetical protein GCM10022407_40380 [Hymenobacter antarcticus]|uniref:Uncharacterized protein n=1 Tax=Hymenobacter antarcticus TaxID=486270 RepID=A0ABP7R3Q7_9BACT